MCVCACVCVRVCVWVVIMVVDGCVTVEVVVVVVVVNGGPRDPNDCSRFCKSRRLGCTNKHELRELTQHACEEWSTWKCTAK